MKQKLYLFVSVFVSLGICATAYGWTKYNTLSYTSRASTPKGDCLEMRCKYGCVENDNYEGKCCSEGKKGGKCYGGLCCQGELICSSTTGEGTCGCASGTTEYTKTDGTGGCCNNTTHVLTSITGSANKACCPKETPLWDGQKCVECIIETDCSGERVCSSSKTCGCASGTTGYTKTDGSTGCCLNDRWTGSECCPEGWHVDGSICCPYGQGNKDGKCTCENPKNNCGTSCCNGAGEICRDPVNGICCAHELCGGVCCPTGSICQSNQCTNPCQEGEHIVDYFDQSGVKKQTCCPTDSMGADWSGACCPEGLVGAFGHNHNWSYISRCCPKEGQEDKGMLGLRGLAETYGCAPPDTTMDASQEIGVGGVGHTWYVPMGSKNVRADGWACAPEEKRGGTLHVTCGAGVVCRYGWKKGRDCSYCYGQLDANNICHLPDCTKPREHIGYCYCNPENGSVTEYNYYTGGTWASSYPNDVCVTPQDGSKTPKCTKGYTFYNKTYGCMSCETYFASYGSGISDRDNCLNCPQAIWNNNKCLACLNGKKPNLNREACE